MLIECFVHFCLFMFLFCAASRSFPYVVRRLPVVQRQVTELGPLTVALHEMRQRVTDLEEVVFSSPSDAKKLQLILQVFDFNNPISNLIFFS
jgi:hypothetical protein